MPKFDYRRAAATASRLIARFGQTGAIRRKTISGHPWQPVVTMTDYPCSLVVLDYARGEVDGALIEAGDKRVYVSSDGVPADVSLADGIVIGGTPYTIVNISPLNPGGTVVYYEIQARL